MSDLPTTIPALADAYGEIDAQIKALEQRRDAIKAELAKRKADAFAGTGWTITRSTYETSRVDTAAIKAEMGAEWLAARSKTTSATRWTVKRALPVIELPAAA